MEGGHKFIVFFSDSRVSVNVICNEINISIKNNYLRT